MFEPGIYCYYGSNMNRLHHTTSTHLYSPPLYSSSLPVITRFTDHHSDHSEPLFTWTKPVQTKAPMRPIAKLALFCAGRQLWQKCMAFKQQNIIRVSCIHIALLRIHHAPPFAFDSGKMVIFPKFSILFSAGVCESWCV